MATQPTNLPVPSESPFDFKFNAGKIDEFVTSLVNTYVDRFGNEHYTIEGLRWLAQQAISQYGWIPVGTFQAGATLTSPNQILKDTADGEYYRWDGSFLPSGKVVPNGSTPGSTGGVGTGAWISVGDSALRSMLASSSGAGFVGYDASLDYLPGTVGYQLGPYAATHGENKFTREDRADRFLFSHDYGSPSSDIGASINKGLDYLFTYATEAHAHGGRLHIPRGLHSVNTQILIDRTAGGVDQSDNISLSGEGMGTSELRAGPGLSAGSSIIKTNEPTGKYIQLMTIRDLTTSGGYNGIRIETASRTNIKNVVIKGAANSGMFVGNSWVNDYSQILSSGNGLHGVEFAADKQKTSTVVTSGYSLANTASGWRWAFMTYCVANGVASDSNGHHGHIIQNSNGFVMNSPGAEANGRAGIYVEASSSLGANKSILIQGAFMHSNNSSNSGWANLLHMRSTDNTVNKVTIRDSTSNSPRVNGPKDIIVDGVGSIAKIDNCEMPNRWAAINGGYVNWVHNNLLVPAINFGAGSARAICTLFSTQGYQNTYGGLITVHVGNTVTSTGARRTATYLLLLNKTLSGTSTVTVVSSAGETSGAVASSPSFTWSINGADQLVANGSTASTAGDFWFEISSNGQVVALAIGA